MNFKAKLNRLLNVSDHEWPRISVAWGLVFLARFSFIIGGSILLAIFLSRVGVELLPGLFLCNALFMMLGAFLFRKIIHRIRHELLIVGIVLFAATSLLLSIFFLEKDTLLFFVFFLFAEALMLSQLNILISLFNEELFSPLESQRTFPIIESAETVGGILGGLSLSLFASVFPTYKFILLCVLLFLAILPIVLLFNPRTMDVPKLIHEDSEKEHKSHTRLKDRIKEFKKIPFLRTLMLVVVLNWAIINILEFQYTKAIQQDVFSQEEETLVHEDSIILAAEASNESTQAQIAQKLGTLHLIFYSAALVMQLIFTSRILSFLGISSSMLVHPLVTLLNMIWMTLRFNFFSASMARGSFELSGILFKNAYDSSYYSIPHAMRSDVKEWMQGVMKPLGAIIGTLLMIGIAILLKGPLQTLALNFILITMSFIMVLALFGLGRKYTQMTEHNLSHKLDLPTRLNAVEILAQKGHEDTHSILQKLVKREAEPEVLKENILKTLGAQENIESIPTILDLLSDRKDHLRLAAAEALSHFDQLKKHLKDQSFTRYRVLEVLKDRLKKEHNDAIREVLLSVFFDLAPDTLTEFLVETIKKDSEEKANFITMLRLFHDSNLRYYLENDLKSRDPSIKGACIVALWQFKDLRSELMHHLTQMLNNPKENVVLEGLSACGLIGDNKSIPLIRTFLKADSKKVRDAALLCLGQLQDPEALDPLVNTLSEPGHDWFNTTIHLLAHFPKEFRSILEPALHMRIIQRISHILHSEKGKTLEEFSMASLHVLHKLYEKIHAHHEVHHIKKTLASKEEGSL